MSHLQEQELLSKKQYSFISGKLITIQLLNYLDQYMQTIVDGGVVDSTTTLNLQRHLTPSHTTVCLQSFKHMVLKMLNWISEFIRGRSQDVIVNGAISETAPVVPLGTV